MSIASDLQGTLVAPAQPAGRGAARADAGDGRGPAPVATPLTVTVAAASDAAEWDAFVASQPDATGYHSWGWRGVFERAFGHRPIYIVARRGSAIRGVLPLVQINSRLFGRSLTSLPFLNYGGVLADDQQAAEALVTAAAEIARAARCPHVELRHQLRRFPHLADKQHKVSMLLSLKGVGWDSLDKKVRNQIRKAQKSELTVASGGLELLPHFYAVFARNMRDLGTPVYGRAFFVEILRSFPGQAQLHVVYVGGRPVAAGLTYHHRRTLEIPWASSVREFNHLCPNHLLYWTVIERAIALQCEVFDFGRSTPGEGTYKFKEQWGALPLSLHWEYVLLDGELPNASPTNAKYAAAIEAWKRLPLAVANALGPHIVRGIP
jgi:serine/alanine adding enzyme